MDLPFPFFSQRFTDTNLLFLSFSLPPSLRDAKDRKLRLWKDYVSKESEKEQQFSGKVVKIITADTMAISIPEGGERKVSLASFRQPKYAWTGVLS